APIAPAPAGRRRARNRSCRGLPGTRLLRHAEAALGDDVLLDLRRAAADDEAEREHVVERPDAAVADALVVPAERAVGAEDLQRRLGEVVVQLGRDELVDRGRDAGTAAADRVGELAVRLELHRLDADGERGEPLA